MRRRSREKSPTVFYIRELVVEDSKKKELRKIWAEENMEFLGNRVGMDKIRAKTSTGRYLVDFVNNSCIHGLNHLAAPHRHVLERFLAVLFIVGALGCLIALSITFWNRYQHQSTVVVLDHDYRSFSITKPALIACPVEAADPTSFPEVFKKYGIKDTPEARNFFTFISNVTYDTMTSTPDYEEVHPDQWLRVLYDLRPVSILYEGNAIKIPTWVVTERGICLTFRNLVGVYYSIEYWLANNWTVAHVEDELHYYSYMDRTAKDIMSIKNHDIRVSLFHPNEVLEFKDDHYHVPPITLLSLTLIITETSSSERVRKLSVPQRECKYLQDGGLNMWPVYSYKMCILECRYDIIRKLCGCYPHFARPIPGVPTCNVTQMRCIGMNQNRIVNLKPHTLSKCGCISNCDTTFYTTAEFNYHYLKAGSPKDRITIVSIQFPTDKYHREEFFGLNNFLASVGGAAGLFLGASVLSFVEIFYYATLRLFWYRVNLHRKRKPKKSDSTILHDN
ncbi:pickpocket protein 19-like [Orussus abietinus]|uniref:pickpocket protein 19-like n=1 Tax=Orussus abietinus TaxID=222816 RepID=UPI000C715E60|nr:pickpocket protein 19-like [Orussus abietinus]